MKGRQLPVRYLLIGVRKSCLWEPIHPWVSRVLLWVKDMVPAGRAGPSVHGYGSVWWSYVWRQWWSRVEHQENVASVAYCDIGCLAHIVLRCGRLYVPEGGVYHEGVLLLVTPCP